MLVYAAKWHISRQVFTPLRRISAYGSRHARPCNREHHCVKGQGGPDKKPTESKSLSPEDCPEELGNRQHLGDSAAPRAQECERRPQVPSRGLITEDRHARPVLQPGEHGHRDSGSLPREDKNGRARMGREEPHFGDGTLRGNPSPEMRNQAHGCRARCRRAVVASFLSPRPGSHFLLPQN